jgi:hypothetical protein
MYAGKALKQGVPTMPIASFYGPNAKADAQLFAAAREILETGKAMAMLADHLSDVLRSRTDGQLDLSAMPLYRRTQASAKLARLLAAGIEVVEIDGTEHGKPIAYPRMPIRDAFLWLMVDSNDVHSIKTSFPLGILAVGELSEQEAARADA